MKKNLVLTAALTLCLLAAVGCSAEKTSSVSNTDTTTENITETASDSAEETSESSTEETSSSDDKIASPDEMVTPEDIVDENMTPIYADSIKDGVYDITVDSSSSMFNITSCELTVADGKMSAVMTMSGKGYLYLFMGKGEEAINADESEYIPFVENDNEEHTFTVPVEALDMGINCTAFSKNKEKWYDRIILFRADSLPVDAFNDDVFVSADTLGLEDGKYTAEVSLAGGSGRASVTSPADITVTDGKITAVIEWSSPNYDYMIVNDEKFLPINTEGNSVFEIPVEVFDFNIPVKADTTAMSEPHEIEYTLSFSSETLTKE